MTTTTAALALDVSPEDLEALADELLTAAASALEADTTIDDSGVTDEEQEMLGPALALVPLPPLRGTAAGASAPHECSGCWPDHADPNCAACGAEAAVVLPCDEHGLTLCQSCWAVVRQIRQESRRKAKAGGWTVPPLPRAQPLSTRPSTKQKKTTTTTTKKSRTRRPAAPRAPVAVAAA